jgi:hypothetical protein
MLHLPPARPTATRMTAARPDALARKLLDLADAAFAAGHAVGTGDLAEAARHNRRALIELGHTLRLAHGTRPGR